MPIRNALKGIKAREVVTIWAHGEIERRRAHVPPEGEYDAAAVELPAGVEATPEIIGAAKRWFKWYEEAKKVASCATYTRYPNGEWIPIRRFHEDIWLEVDGKKFAARIPGWDASGMPLAPRIVEVPPPEAFGLPRGMEYGYPYSVDSPDMYGIKCSE